jgi:5-methylcytosine-specific restriction endonuclease McrA
MQKRLSQKYRTYLHSRVWRTLRAKKLAEAKYRCQNCGSRTRLEVHHKTYERLGHERLSDLAVLCSICHHLADKLRKLR